MKTLEQGTYQKNSPIRHTEMKPQNRATFAQSLCVRTDTNDSMTKIYGLL